MTLEKLLSEFRVVSLFSGKEFGTSSPTSVGRLESRETVKKREGDLGFPLRQE